MKTESAPLIPASSFACHLCGARLDRAHLDFAADGSHCTFCGAPQPDMRANGFDAGQSGGSLDIGDALHGARLTRGETLEQAARFTRIQLTYLRALEHDDTSSFEPFPGTTYARYFLRDYAEHLGIDPEPLVRRFDSEVSTPVVAAIGREPVAERTPHPRRWALGALAVLIVLLVSSAMWVQRASDLPVGISLPAATRPGRYIATGPIGPRGAVHLAPAAIDHIWVTVRTTDEPSWVTAAVDGSVITQETVLPGAVRRWRADRMFTLRLGNAGAVILTVNGRRIPTGGYGAVIDFSFGLRQGAIVRL